jgi:hypothetical protein
MYETLASTEVFDDPDLSLPLPLMRVSYFTAQHEVLEGNTEWIHKCAGIISTKGSVTTRLLASLLFNSSC